MEELFVNRAPPPLPPKNRSGAICPTANGAGATVLLNQVITQVHSSHTSINSATTTSASDGGGYVVKIKINPENGEQKPLVSSVQLNASEPVVTSSGCVRISVGDQPQPEDMLHRSTTVNDAYIKTDQQNPYFFCSSFPCVTNVNTVMSSGQCSPSDTLDSGTCSDLDSTPPPLPKKKSVTVTVIGTQHKRASSLTSSGADADSGSDNESNISCDSLNSSDLNGNLISDHDNKLDETEINKLSEVPVCPPSPPLIVELNRDNGKTESTYFSQGLLQDIRDRSAKLSQQEAESRVVETIMTADEEQCPAKQIVFASVRPSAVVVSESTYEERKLVEQRKDEESKIATVEAFNEKIGGYMYESDKYYKFHLNENVVDTDSIVSVKHNADEDGSFAGYRDLLIGTNGSSTIKSAKGTIRGVKNRVRAGIATFLQINSTTKSYKEKDAGKLVVYSTTMGIVRNTYHQCLKVKQILRTHLVKFEERDVFMSTEFQSEIRDRMHSEHILIPQVFVDGQHIGDAETIERLNETGELRRILKPYKSQDACSTCAACGGYRLLPCPVCSGSKKSLHRNHFTTEFVALKCMNCDEVGLVRCSSC